MSGDEHVAHVLDDQGVTDAPFRRDGNTWTNAEEITLRPGAVLDLGNSMTLTLVDSNGLPVFWVDDQGVTDE